MVVRLGCIYRANVIEKGNVRGVRGMEMLFSNTRVKSGKFG